MAENRRRNEDDAQDRQDKEGNHSCSDAGKPGHITFHKSHYDPYLTLTDECKHKSVYKKTYGLTINHIGLFRIWCLNYLIPLLPLSGHGNSSFVCPVHSVDAI